MTENSKIEWTDHTFNPWIGCTKVSDGCKNCYAEQLMDKRYGKVEWGPQGTRLRTSAANWKLPFKWNRLAKGNKTRARVFCASLADVFEDRPELEQWRMDLFQLIDLTPNLDWLLLTKRPENVLRMVRHDWIGSGFPLNVWLGTSVENQAAADERIPELLKIPARVRFLSMEPLLGPVDLNQWLLSEHGRRAIGAMPGIHWVIVGGESGPHARPMHPDWARSIRDQCQAAGVPFFFKQWGEWRHLSQFSTGELMKIDRAFPAYDWSAMPYDISAKVGKHATGRLLDGVEHNNFPQAVRA